MNSATNHNQDYYLDKAAAEGTNLYYAILFESDENKTLIKLFHALSDDISEIIHECSDPGVARIKLKWWQEEIERLSNNEPRHPITKELHHITRLDKEILDDFKLIISHFEEFLFLEQTNSLEESLSYFYSTSGLLWQQHAKHIEISDQTTLEKVNKTAALYHYLSCLQQPIYYLSETRCIIPSCCIEQASILKLKENISEDRSKQQKHFSVLLKEIKQRLDENYIIESKIDRRKLKHILILNRLAAKTCEEIINDGCQLLNSRLSLTPIRKLWIAWRTSISINYFQEIL